MGVDILFIAEKLDPRRRRDYMREIGKKLQAVSGEKLVLLDPDTGMEPKRAKPEHVRESEVKEIWERLGRGDWLVLYRHASRNTGWQGFSKRKFGRACGGIEPESFKAPGITKSVVLFAGKKP